MSFRSPSLVVVAVAGMVCLTAAQQPRFQSGTSTVSVYATVLDAGGRLVPGLARDDFEVFDDGVKQPLTVFDANPQPIAIVVMLDRSGSMASHFVLVQRAAEAFVADLRPDDRARIGNFSDRIEIDPPTFTSDREALLRILRENLQPAGTSPIWNATNAAMNALTREEHRRVVLVFTDGRDTPGLGVNTTFEDLRARTEKDETMVYAIGLSERCGDDDPPTGVPRKSPSTPGRPVLFQQRPPARPPIGGPRGPARPPIGEPGGPGVPRWPPIPGATPPFSRPSSSPSDDCRSAAPDPALRALADVGGGGYFELRGTDDLASTFARVADELHHQYLLAFTASVLDGRSHRLEVRLRRPGLRARARTSYLAVPPASSPEQP